jgi:glutaconate CoA-transferase subunit B
MILSSYHPGLTLDQVKDETGWPLLVADDVHETTAPTDEELAAVRKYDPKGIWTS